MSNRVNYYFRQKVTEAELDKGFDYLEQADRDFATDLDLLGIANGLAVAPQGTPNMTVAVSGGAAYDATGRRIRVPSAQNVNCALDHNGVATTVAAPGNEKWLGIYVGFELALSDPRTDGNSLNVYFEEAETFALRVVQGAEAGAGLAVRPALDAARVLLADVKLVHGQTSVTSGDISTTRRQNTFAVTGAARSLARGTLKLALADLLGWYDDHVTGADDRHAAADVDYGGTSAWVDGTTNPATDLESMVDSIVTRLTATTGDVKVGSPARTGANGNFSLSAGSVGSQLTAIKTRLDALPNRIIAALSASIGSQSTSSTTYVDLPGASLAFTAVAGDIITCTAALSAFMGVGGDTFDVGLRLVVEDGGVPTVVTALDNLYAGAIVSVWSIAGRHVVGVSGAVTLKLQYKASAAKTLVVQDSGNGMLVGTQIRP